MRRFEQSLGGSVNHFWLIFKNEVEPDVAPFPDYFSFLLHVASLSTKEDVNVRSVAGQHVPNGMQLSKRPQVPGQESTQLRQLTTEEIVDVPHKKASMIEGSTHIKQPRITRTSFGDHSVQIQNKRNHQSIANLE